MWLRLLVESVPLVMIRLDAAGRFIWVNKLAREFFGETVCGTNFSEYLLNIEDSQEIDIAALFSPKRETLGAETSMLRKDGQMRLLKWNYKVFKEDAKITGVIATALDINSFRESELRLKESEKRYRALFEKNPVGILRYDLCGNVIDINQRYLDIQGEVKGKTDESFNIFNSPRSFLLPEVDSLSRVITTGEPVRGEIKCTNSGGETVWIGYLAEPWSDDKGNTTQAILACHEITWRKIEEARIRHLSITDELTGLHNRTFLRKELKRLDVAWRLPLSIIIGDVNGLKLVNDGFGHSQGDNFLITIASILKNACRKEDIVARIGGDEFAILLPKTGIDSALKICSRIKEACQKADTGLIKPDIALGAAVKKVETEDINEVIYAAEIIMYKDKLLASRLTGKSITYLLEERLLKKASESYEHIKRLEDLGTKFGKVLGLEEEQLERFAMFIKLHDVGKVGIPDLILNKKGRFTAYEREIIKRHAEVGYRILRNCPEFVTVTEEVLNHHERWEGTGYPRGIKGEEIPFLARIMAIIDAYEAMTHYRPYRAAVSSAEALDEIEKCSGSQFDPHLVPIFIKMIKQSGEG